MISLSEALESLNPRQKPGIVKHLATAHIDRWEDFDKWHLARFAGEVKETMAPSSAHTTFAVLKAFLAQFEDELPNLPKNYREILKAKNEAPMKTYLTKEEVEAFGNAWLNSDMERTVRDGFYVSCKTGLRHSDLIKLLPSNFQKREEGGWYLNYVSKKTRIQSTIICSDATKEKVEWLHKHGKQNLSISYYNNMVRELAQRAEINTEVSVYKAGKEISGPKWMFLSSHSARISFCTILADLGTDILDIMQMAGHKDTQTTIRYIVRHDVKLNPKVESFLM